MKRKNFKWKECLILVFLVLMIFVIIKFSDVSVLESTIDELGIFGPIIFILAKISTIVFAPLIGTPLYLIAGPLFGFKKGLFYVFIGDIIGHILCFFISRFFGRPIVKHLVLKKGMHKIDEILKRLENWKGHAIVRLLFSWVPEFVSYALGLTKVPFWQFFLGLVLIWLVLAPLMVAVGMSFVNETVFQVVSLTSVALALVTGVIYFAVKKHKKNGKKQ